MKKLLLWSLVGIFAGNVMAVVTTQSAFADLLVRRQQELDSTIMAEIEKIILQADRGYFCNDLIRLNDKNKFTPDEILSLFNKEYNKTGNDITSLKNLHIAELLKEQKIYAEIHEQISSYRFYDEKPGNGLLTSLYIFLVALIPVLPHIPVKHEVNGSSLVELSQANDLFWNGLIIGIGKGVAFSMAVYCLCYVGNGYHKLRNIKHKIDTIDGLIKKIEAMEHE